MINFISDLLSTQDSADFITFHNKFKINIAAPSKTIINNPVRNPAFAIAKGIPKTPAPITVPVSNAVALRVFNDSIMLILEILF